VTRVFLSHSSDDKEFVTVLNASLYSVGIETFFDLKDILVGQSIPDAIYEGITESTHLIYVISEKSVNSEWVREELSIAKMKEKSGAGIKILPILIDDVCLPTSIIHLRYADFKDWRNPSKYREAFLLLLKSLGVAPKLLGTEDVKWYVKNSSEIKECVKWINDAAFEIQGALSAAQSIGSPDAHIIAVKNALHYSKIQQDLRKIISLIPDYEVGQRLQSLKEKAKIALDYIDKDLSEKMEYKDASKADKLKNHLKDILEIIEQARSELEFIMLSGFLIDN
jgi:hypothetical protein